MKTDHRRSAPRCRRVAALLLAMLWVVLAAGCAPAQPDTDADDRLQIVASFFPVYDFARKIAATRAVVTWMVPPGADPHTWEPAAADIAAVGKADLFIYNGAGMEHWIEAVLAGAGSASLTVVETAAGVPLRAGGHTQHVADHAAVDPHIWLAPALVKIQLANIRDALIQVDPAGAATYHANFDHWAAEVDQLDAAYRAALAPYKGREVVVAHEAFGYLCDAYDLVQLPVEGLTPDSEPDPARMAEIIRMARERNIQVVFFDRTASSKVADTLAAEIGARVDVLDPVASLREEEIAQGVDWFTVMRANLRALTHAFS